MASPFRMAEYASIWIAPNSLSAIKGLEMISNANEHPLQVFIRLKLEKFQDSEFMVGWNEPYASDSVIYALIVCSIIPILIIYPFIQKYFAKGVNVGGVKE